MKRWRASSSLLFCFDDLQAREMACNAGTATPAVKVESKANHPSRFTAVKDSRKRKVRGRWAGREASHAKPRGRRAFDSQPMARLPKEKSRLILRHFTVTQFLNRTRATAAAELGGSGEGEEGEDAHGCAGLRHGGGADGQRIRARRRELPRGSQTTGSRRRQRPRRSRR